MRKVFPAVIAFAVLFSFSAMLRAEDKATTLTGTLTCAKCDLKETDACQNVLKVKDGDKTVMYYLNDSDATKDTHGKVCKGAKENVTVTGMVEEKDGKKWITVSKIEGLS